MATSDRDLIERYIQAEAERDWDKLVAMRHDDWAEDWPQSGERIVGSVNWRLVHENFPGYPDIHVGKIEGADPVVVTTPAFTLVRLSGAGDAWVVQGINHYPDGSVYHIVKLVELRDARVHKETTYFSPRSDAPEWRAEWVQRVGQVDKKD
jgi:hypothetical protein